jgi:adenylate cyclase
MKRLLRWRRWFTRRFGYARLVCLALLAGFAFLRVAIDPPPMQELRVRTFDNLQRLAPRVKKVRPVTIVDIDERSLASPKLGQWPWPRTRIAEIVANLTRAGALVIAFDVVFSEPDRLNPDIAADSFGNLDEATREKLRSLPSNDRILADAIGGSRVVLGESGLPAKQAEIDKQEKGIAKLGEPEPFLYQWPGLLRNIPVLEKAAAGHGVFTIKPERDGIVRRAPMVLQAQGVTMPSLTMEMLRIVAGADTVLIKADRQDGVQSIRVGRFQIPTDANGQLWVHYARHDPLIYVSAIDVLEGRVPPEMVNRKLVLIGTSAAGLNDLKAVPVPPAMPGVEIHAQVLESALTGAVVSQPNWGFALEFFSAMILGLLVIAVAPRFGALSLVAIGAVFATALIGISVYFFIQHRQLIDFTYPLLSTTAIYLTLVFSSFVREQQQRRQIRGQFAQYMSPVLVEQLAQSPEKLVLGGEQREMTVMFSDMRGFTSISETYKDDPQGLTALMNRFLTPLTNTILARKGYIDKYMGDAVMAFWNAPLDDNEHQLNACDAAVEMLEQIDELNKEREQEAEEGGPSYVPLNIGVGLNTGACVVGNMGSDQKFNYSVYGDSVNLASRLEGQSKEYGFPIIVGSKTALAAKDKFAILELDFIMVKGKKEPEVIYAIAGREDVMHSARFQRLRNLTLEMLAAYRSRDWEEALAAIERGRRTDEANALEKLYDLYETRIRAFQQDPPPEDWNGAYALTTK